MYHHTPLSLFSYLYIPPLPSLSVLLLMYHYSRTGIEEFAASLLLPPSDGAGAAAFAVEAPPPPDGEPRARLQFYEVRLTQRDISSTSG